MSESLKQMPQEGTQEPVISKIQPQVAPLPQKPLVTPKTESYEVAEYVPMRMIRYANYDYKTGTTFFLSKTEQIVVDAYLKTNNVTEACRALNAIRQAHGSYRKYTPNAVSRWLRKPHVARHIGEKFMDKGKFNWMTEDKWYAWGADVMQGSSAGTTQVQVAVWKEYGKARGWYKENQPAIQNNTQINFVQSDGKA